MMGGMPQHMGPGYGMDMSGNASGQQDWNCPSCGNKNYSSRSECNMRKCRAPRPDAGMGGPPMGGFGGPPMGGPPVVFHPMHGGAAFGKRPAEDFSGGPNKRMRDSGGGEGADWPCPQCNNINFASRMVCNMRKCGAPRPDRAALPFITGDTMGWGSPRKGAPMSAAASSNPEWVCIQCGNINYSTRENCNMRICGAPRPGTAAPAPAKVEKATPIAQAGDWVCPKCANVNFSSRTVCNMRKCQAAKPTSDEAAAEVTATEADETDAEAAWTSATTTEAQAPSDAVPESF